MWSAEFLFGALRVNILRVFISVWVGRCCYHITMTQFWSSELSYKLTYYTFTVELQWLEHLWDYENVFETRVVRAIEDLLYS